MARPRDYKAEYQRRIARGLKRGQTPSQARGHPKKDEVPASKIAKEVQIVGRGGSVVVETRSHRERRRASDYDNAVDALTQGRISPREFDRRWAGKSIGGVDLPTSGEVLALSHRNLVSIGDFYPHRGAP